MKKKPATKKAAKIQTPVPPLAAAIVTFADPGYKAIPPRFQRAWDAAPELVRRFSNNQESGEPRHVWVSRQAEAAIEQSRNAKERYDRQLAEAVDYLDAKNEDLLYHVHSAYSEPAFAIGLALGIYLSTNGGGR